MRNLQATLCGISLAFATAATAVCQQPNQPTPQMLELVPGDAQAALAIHDVDRLKSHWARLSKEDGMPETMVDNIDRGITWLDSKPALDQSRPLVLAVIPLTGDRMDLDDAILFVPVKPDAKVDAQLIAPIQFIFPLVNRQLTAHENYALFTSKKDIDLDRLKLDQNSLQHSVSPTLANQLNSADLLLFLDPRVTGNDWEKVLKRYNEAAKSWRDRRLRALGMRLVEDLSNVRHVFLTLDFREGLTVQASAVVRNPDESPPFIFDRLYSAPAQYPPHYRGLPQKPLLAAAAFGDSATHNAETMTVMNRLEMLNFVQELQRLFAGEWKKSTVSHIIELLASSARKTNGVRGAAYQDHTLAMIIDTSSPDRVVAALRELIADQDLASLLEYVNESETIDGVTVDSVRLRDASRLTAASETTRAKAILAVVSHGLRIAQLDGHVLISAEVEPVLLREMIANIQQGRAGLADDIKVPNTEEGQIQLFDFRFHANQFFKYFGPNRNDGKTGLFAASELSRVGLYATRREFSFKIEIPHKDFVESVKNGGWW